MTPRARPRSASGTTRWKIVASTTSTRRLPAEATVIATSAGTIEPTAPSPANPTARRTDPPTSGGTRLGRSMSAPDTTAATSPPTPIAALR